MSEWKAEAKQQALNRKVMLVWHNYIINVVLDAKR